MNRKYRRRWLGLDWSSSRKGKFRTFVKTVMKCRKLREHLSKRQFYKKDFCIELFGWVISQSLIICTLWFGILGFHEVPGILWVAGDKSYRFKSVMRSKLLIFTNLFTVRYKQIIFLLLAQQSPVGQGPLIHEVSKSHTTTHHSR
jgi:hypothetical protein